MEKKKGGGKKYEAIVTDIQVHARQFRNPKTLDQQIERSIRSGKPFRVYASKVEIVDPENHIVRLFFEHSPNSRIGRDIQLSVPDGLVVQPSSDAAENDKAERKRIKLLTEAQRRGKMKNEK